MNDATAFFFDYFVTNPWLTPASIILAIAGLFATYVFYKKSNKVQKPVYTIQSNNIIRDFISNISDLEIKYAGELIENLTVSRITFWNAGNEVIDKEDIVRSDPIMIRACGDNKLLKAEIISQNEMSNNFALSPIIEGKFSNVNFDYISQNNGIIIQAFHTGKQSEDIEFIGKTKSAGKPRNISNGNLMNYIIKLLILPGTPILVGILLFEVVILNSIDWILTLASFFVAYILLIAGFMLFILIVWKIDRPGIPRLLPLRLTRRFGFMVVNKGDDISIMTLIEPEGLETIGEDFPT